MKKKAWKIAFVVSLLLMVAYRGLLPFATYKVKTEDFTFKRDALNDDTIPDIPVGQIFSEENIKKYHKGAGLIVEFVYNNHPGQDPHPQTLIKKFELKPWKRYEETRNPDRRKYVAEKHQELLQMVKEFQGHIPKTVSFKLFIDDTNGIDSNYRSFVERKIESELKVKGRLRAGDMMKVDICRLTSSDFLDYESVTFTRHAEQEFEDILARWLADSPPKRQSSIATGLFGALRQLSREKKEKVLIFSDGMENSQFTAVFYEAGIQAILSNQNSWPKIEKILTSVENVPDLNGLEIDWYIPPADSALSLSPVLRSAGKFWQWLLQKHGATVRYHI